MPIGIQCNFTVCGGSFTFDQIRGGLHKKSAVTLPLIGVERTNLLWLLFFHRYIIDFWTFHNVYDTPQACIIKVHEQFRANVILEISFSDLPWCSRSVEALG